MFKKTNRYNWFKNTYLWQLLQAVKEEYLHPTPVNKVAQRRARMLVRLIIDGLITALGILIAYWEFGSVIFHRSLFWGIVGAWVYLSLTQLLDKWDTASQKTTDEKLDELIIEIRKDRELRDGSNNPK